MTKINLKVQLREITGKKVNKFLHQGLIPAVMYGRKASSQNLWVKKVDFVKVYKQSGENTLIELEIENGQKANVLIHDVQFNPINDNFSHVDFFQVRMDEKVETSIPLEFIGEAPAVKELGGIFLKGLDEIEISCLPADLPSKIEVDISCLKTFDNNIKVKDINVSNKINILTDKETVVASISPPRSEEELAKLDEKVEEDVTKVIGVVKENLEEKISEKDKKEKE